MKALSKSKKYFIISLILTLIMGCTTKNNFYTGDDDLEVNEDFSVINTILLPVAILGVVAIAYGASQGSSNNSNSYSSSCTGPYCNENAAWDYLPGSAQYRCRATSNGQFVNSSYCSYQYKQDNWS
ncbi:hypothetical protein [Photobacterium andalusiense]|uniref:Lipoprotein n=1 Tax=Photobacterium andalusiense TaxID=2204296 RepID=A0A1Y6MQS3_9GAMM|nr:hypothetical protein [Photobacterium andalusiense]SMY38229.1 hypothetical protein PAND9192_03510 [Photobacterium andalusiense]